MWLWKGVKAEGCFLWPGSLLGAGMAMLVFPPVLKVAHWFHGFPEFMAALATSSLFIFLLVTAVGVPLVGQVFSIIFNNS